MESRKHIFFSSVSSGVVTGTGKTNALNVASVDNRAVSVVKRKWFDILNS